MQFTATAAFLSTQFLYIVHMLVFQRLCTRLSERERVKRQGEDSFKAVLHFISHCIHVRFIKEEFVEFRWISICFMIAKNACLCYICILCFMHIRLAFSATLSIVRFYCIHDSILFHLKMQFNGLSQSASFASFSRGTYRKKLIIFPYFINKK